MHAILRALFVYFFLWLIFRVSGKRTLSEVTTFDFILLLIIGEATQEALIDQDHSIIGSMILITTLIFTDVSLSFLSYKFKIFERILNNVPLIILVDGKPLKSRMSKARIETDDILEAARINEGLESLDQIKYAILEKDGTISILPKAKNQTKAIEIQEELS